MKLETKLSTEPEYLRNSLGCRKDQAHISSKQKCKISSKWTVLIISLGRTAFVPGELMSVMIILYDWLHPLRMQLQQLSDTSSKAVKVDSRQKKPREGYFCRNYKRHRGRWFNFCRAPQSTSKEHYRSHSTEENFSFFPDLIWIKSRIPA